VQARGTAHRTLPAVATQAASVIQYSAQPAMLQCINTWWLIPLSKWVITPVLSGLTLLIPPVINGISRANPLRTGVITHLLIGWATKQWQPRKIKLLVATEELAEVFLRRSQVKHLRTLKSRLASTRGKSWWGLIYPLVI
jgi:hypothetical protein